MTHRTTSFSDWISSLIRNALCVAGAVLAGTSSTSRAQSSAPQGDEDRGKPSAARVAALTRTVDKSVSAVDVDRVLAVGMGVSSVLWGVGLPLANEDPADVIGFRSAASTMFTAHVAVHFGASITTFLVPEDYQPAVVESGFLLGSGLLLGSVAASEPRFNDISVVTTPVALGSLVSGLLRGTSAFLRRPPRTSLRLSHLKQRAKPIRALSEQELQAIEADLRAASGPIPNWAVFAPLVLGSVVSVGWGVATAVEDSRSSSPSFDSVVEHSVVGVAGAVVGLVLMLRVIGREESYYRDRLADVALDLRATVSPHGTPGLALAGVF